MVKALLIICSLLAVAAQLSAAQTPVQLEPFALNGPRTLQDQTRAAVIRDYLLSWKSLRAALDQNQPELLNADFVGTAKDTLTDTIHRQAALGLRTQYQDRAHDIQIVFYSPEGLSIELTDKVDYVVGIFDHDKVLTSTQHISARYIVVLTPAEVRWRVRVFQAVPE